MRLQQPVCLQLQLVTAPASVIATHEPDLPIPPQSWLHRAYPNMTWPVTLYEGGHFLVLELPERFPAEIRDAFRLPLTGLTADPPPSVRTGTLLRIAPGISPAHHARSTPASGRLGSGPLAAGAG